MSVIQKENAVSIKSILTEER